MVDVLPSAPSGRFRLPAPSRWLALGWYLLFAAAFWVFPRTGEGVESTRLWSDQSLFLRTLNEALATGTSEAMNSGFVGPGYIAIARVLHTITGLPPDETLVLLAKLCFFVTGVIVIACAERQTRGHVTDLRFPVMLVSVGVLYTSVWAFAADLPWTHFQETALLALLVFLAGAPRKGLVTWAVIGFLLVMAYQTRPYEGAVMFLAITLTGIAWLVAVRFRFNLRTAGASALAALAGAILAVGFLDWATGIAQPVSQYRALDSTFKIYPLLLPYKFVQLFVDTCFYTVCESARSVPANILAIDPSLAGWRQPLSLQHPAILAATVAIIVLLVGSSAARRALFQPRVSLPLLIAGGTIIAYTAAVPSGSPHLRYGFMRDYTAAMVLLFMALCALLTAEATLGDTGPVPISRNKGFALAAFVTIALVLMILRPLATNFLPQYVISSLSYTASCADKGCGFAVQAINKAGAPMAIPGVTVFTKQCGDQQATGVVDLSQVTYDPRLCSSVVLFPAVTGLYGTPTPTEFVNEPSTN